MHLSKKEMKLETNVITIVTQPSSVALKRCMTSPSYINIPLLYSLRNSRPFFVRNSSLSF
jgi:predicted aldo/keto reductase-like oxidoreductase